MTAEFRLADPMGELMDTIARPEATIKELTVTYGLALRDQGSVDWPKVNKAIIERWSVATLERVKKAAWNPRRQAVHDAARMWRDAFGTEP